MGIASYEDILWTRHAIFLPHEAKGSFLALCLLTSRSRVRTQRSSTDTRVAIPRNTWRKAMSTFFRRHLFAGLVSIESWLKCWKPTESLLGTLEMIRKRQTTDVSFHRVCETVTIICLHPLQCWLDIRQKLFTLKALILLWVYSGYYYLSITHCLRRLALK